MVDHQQNTEAFAARIAHGEIPTPASDQLDALLHWLVGRDIDQARAIQKGFDRCGVTADQAKSRTLFYLDATLFSYEADPYRLFGLVPDCTFADIRARHKRLLQVFHPDRHNENKKWFTNRSEWINRAYSHLKQYHGRAPDVHRTQATVTPPQSPSRNTSASRQPRKTQWRVRGVDKKTLRRRLTEYLGNAATLQQRLYIVLFALPIGILLVLYVSNTGNVESGGLPAPRSEVPAERVGKNMETEQVPAEEATSQRKPDREAAGDSDTNLSPASMDSWLVQHLKTGTSKYAENEGVDASSRAGFSEELSRPFSSTAPAPADEFTPISASDPESNDKAGRDTRTAKRVRAGEPTSKDSSVYAEKGQASRNAAAQKAEPEETKSGVQSLSPAGLRVPKMPDQSKEKEEQDSSEPEELAVARASNSKGVKDMQEQSPEATTSATLNRPSSQIRKEREAMEKSPEAGQDTASWNNEVEPSVSKRNDDIQMVRSLLSTYQNTYNDSDIDRFGALFLEDATTKTAHGKTEIKDVYGEFFERTKNRNLVLSNMRITLLGDRQFKVDVRYSTYWTYQSGKSKQDDGNLTFHLAPSGKQLKIWRLDY